MLHDRYDAFIARKFHVARETKSHLFKVGTSPVSHSFSMKRLYRGSCFSGRCIRREFASPIPPRRRATSPLSPRAQHRLINKAWYAAFGIQSMVSEMWDVSQGVTLEVDGNPVRSTPGPARAAVLLGARSLRSCPNRQPPFGP